MTYRVSPYVFSTAAHGYYRAWLYEIYDAGRLTETVRGFHTKEEADKAARLAVSHWDRPEVE